VASMTSHYLSRSQVAERIGARDSTLSGYKLPQPDVTIGPVNADGTLKRGSFAGWLPETIDRWHANRPGRGARTDLRRNEAVL
jgi:hypothetical protein